MNNLSRSWRLWALALAVTVMPWCHAQAQAPKPMAVVSLASIDQLLRDVDYIGRAVGQPQARGMAELVGGQFLEGIDRTRPIGVVLTMKEGSNEPDFLAFVPVTDFDAVIAKIEQTTSAEAEDAGNGVKKVTLDRELFFKEASGWGMVANKLAALTDAPKDPVAILGGLNQKYTLSVRVNVQSIPKSLRDQVVEQIKQGYEQSLQQGDVEVLAQQVGQMNINSIVKSITETDEVQFGWSIDSAGKRALIDFGMTALAGTSMAKQMAALMNAKSTFTGFLMDDAAVTANTSSQLDAESITQTTAMLKGFREKLLEQLDEDLDDMKLRSGIKEVVGELFDAVQQTVEAGQADFGGSLVLKPNALSFAGGSLVADGNKVDAAFRKLVEVAKNQPDFPEVKLNAGEHAGIKFHTIRAPVEDDEAQKVLGQTVEVVVGTGGKAAYLAFGKDGMSILKQAIDKSAAGGSRAVLPAQLTIKLTPIIQFAASIQPDDQNLKQLVKGLGQIAGNDQVLVTEEAVDRGVLVRVQIQEGVLKLIGTAAGPARNPQF